MSDEQVQASSNDIAHESEPPASLSHLLWHPWFAKLWWGSIPIYWLAIGDPTRPAVLDPLARSGYAAITHMIFNPIVPLIVLGAGYFRRAANSDYPASRNAMFNGADRNDYSHTLSGINRFRNVTIRDHLKKMKY